MRSTGRIPDQRVDWGDLRTALFLARAGSVRQAARALGVSHSTVLRRIAALEGSMLLFLEGGRVVEAVPGSFVHIPHGVAHGFRATSALTMLVLSDPAGFLEFVREYGVEAPRRELPPAVPPDVPRLIATAKNHRIEILGPLPTPA